MFDALGQLIEGLMTCLVIAVLAFIVACVIIACMVFA